MAWLRLWDDLPTDQKFRTIARLSKQPLSAVLSVYIFYLVDASKNRPRGTLNCEHEDVASALDLEIECVELIRKAMEGRLILNNYLTGWEKRQIKYNNRPSSEIWKKLRNFVFKRDNYTCKYCGEKGKKLECDHIYPVSRGGGNSEDNLITACFKCNRSKRSKTLQEWRVK
jgi:hypothetical protein